MTERLRLKVKAIRGEQVYRNVVRIPQDHRGEIEQGQICRLSTLSGKALVEVRGKTAETSAVIYMSGRLRAKLDVDVDKFADFTVVPVGWIGRLGWAATSPDANLRLAAQLGVISVALGLLSLAISLMTLPWADIAKWIRSLFP